MSDDQKIILLPLQLQDDGLESDGDVVVGL